MNGFGRRINRNQQLRSKMPSKPHAVGLKCHAETSSSAVRMIKASVHWWAAQALAIDFAVEGDLKQLRIPGPRPPRQADHLWEHTCFEAFVSVKGNAAYYEFNFSPSGEWAAYSFQRYRNRTPFEDHTLAPAITVRKAANRLDLDAVVRVDRLPGIQSLAWLHVGLCAVIEDQSGKLSYWALRHPPGKPDFHHPECFALNLEPAGVAAANNQR